jgi:hypothetical protein
LNFCFFKSLKKDLNFEKLDDLKNDLKKVGFDFFNVDNSLNWKNQIKNKSFFIDNEIIASEYKEMNNIELKTLTIPLKELNWNGYLKILYELSKNNFSTVFKKNHFEKEDYQGVLLNLPFILEINSSIGSNDNLTDSLSQPIEKKRRIQRSNSFIISVNSKILNNFEISKLISFLSNQTEESVIESFQKFEKMLSLNTLSNFIDSELIDYLILENNNQNSLKLRIFDFLLNFDKIFKNFYFDFECLQNFLNLANFFEPNLISIFSIEELKEYFFINSKSDSKDELFEFCLSYCEIFLSLSDKKDYLDLKRSVFYDFIDEGVEKIQNRNELVTRFEMINSIINGEYKNIEFTNEYTQIQTKYCLKHSDLYL